jgi:hypothetical protein
MLRHQSWLQILVSLKGDLGLRVARAQLQLGRFLGNHQDVGVAA